MALLAYRVVRLNSPSVACSLRADTNIIDGCFGYVCLVMCAHRWISAGIVKWNGTKWTAQGQHGCLSRAAVWGLDANNATGCRRRRHHSEMETGRMEPGLLKATDSWTGI